ncbi:MAG: tRNA lysidine(34) synthetase TilS [Candidatus Brocadiia bacterium]
MTHIGQLAQTALESIRAHHMLQDGEAVLVGLSGGPDSVALLMALNDLSQSGELPLTIRTAHLHHGLRGDEADEDAAFCRRLTDRLGIPHREVKLDLYEQQKSAESLEDAGRRVRYRFLARSARDVDACKVATGHHADDQAETVLMRLVRGCGIRGLRAIAPRRPMSCDPELVLIRPLLECGRNDVLNYLDQLDQPYRTDSSNTNTDYQRNYIRHEVIPDLEPEEGSDTTTGLCRIAGLSREIVAALEKKVDRFWDDIRLDDHTPLLSLDAGKLKALSDELRKAVIRRATAELPGVREPGDLSREHYEKAAALPEKSVGDAVSLPGDIIVRREHGILHFTKDSSAPATWETALSLPGHTSLPSGRAISAEIMEVTGRNVDELIREGEDHNVYLSHDAVSPPFIIRNRRPGDVFYPLGSPGHRKLKDFMIDRRIPRHLRDRIPIVVDSSGRILWVAGYEICHHARLRPDSQMAVVLHRAELDNRSG